MNERPILFSAPMVRAILAGTKTQTRRAMKWRGVTPGLNLGFSGLGVEQTPAGWVLTSPSRTSIDWRCDPTPCPYGQPGDRLWVREAWAAPHAFDHLPPRLIPAGTRFHYAADASLGGLLGRPSIHMPRWASRIILEITGVRVERLQAISEADAKAEGAPPSHPSIDRVSREFGYADFPRSWFAQLWEHINGPGSWDANPWVWCVEFKRVQS